MRVLTAFSGGGVVVALEVRSGVVVGVFASILPKHQPVERALVVGVRRGGVPVNVVRLAAHAAVLVVDERHVDARAPDFGILRIEVGSREGVALGIVMCAWLIKQEGVDAVAVPAFGVVVRSNAVAVFVSARGRWAS